MPGWPQACGSRPPPTGHCSSRATRPRSDGFPGSPLHCRAPPHRRRTGARAQGSCHGGGAVAPGLRLGSSLPAPSTPASPSPWARLLRSPVAARQPRPLLGTALGGGPPPGHRPAGPRCPGLPSPASSGASIQMCQDTPGIQQPPRPIPEPLEVEATWLLVRDKGPRRPSRSPPRWWRGRPGFLADSSCSLLCPYVGAVQWAESKIHRVAKKTGYQSIS